MLPNHFLTLTVFYPLRIEFSLTWIKGFGFFPGEIERVLVSHQPYVIDDRSALTYINTAG